MTDTVTDKNVIQRRLETGLEILRDARGALNRAGLQVRAVQIDAMIQEMSRAKLLATRPEGPGGLVQYFWGNQHESVTYTGAAPQVKVMSKMRQDKNLA